MRNSLLLFILFTWSFLCGSFLCVHTLAHDPAPVVPGSSTSNYQNYWIIFPHFAIGTSGNINYSSVIQVTNTNRERAVDIKLYIRGTAVDGQATRFAADYTLNGLDYSKYQVANATIPPLATTTAVFESEGPLKSGFMELNPIGVGEKDEISTSFFFQLRDVNTGELIDSVGVAPSDFGWRFVLPLIVSNKRGINTGIAYSHIPVSQRVQVVFELRGGAEGEQLALKDNIITWADNTRVEPYHEAQFVTEIFPGFFEEYERKVDVFGDTRDAFYGSLHIYAQRNINVLALRMDTEQDDDGNVQVQLTSVPTSGELCIDGPNRKDNCFQEDTQLNPGWVPVRKKSKNELWSDAGGVCDEVLGSCSP